MSYRFSSIISSKKISNETMKYPIAFAVAIASCQTYAAPSPTGFGTFTRDATPKAGSVVSGRYTTLTGAKGTYTISAGASIGYSGRTFAVGNNGVEIKNEADTNIANDSFTYTFAITPDDNTAIHTIKIGQASYTTGGNSEVARHTLSYTPSSAIDAPSRVYVKENASVPFYYQAMGDYFMGRRETSTSDTFVYNDPNTLPSPQLRANSNSELYFYRLDFLNGTNLGNNRFRPSTNNSGQVSIRNNANGFLPSPATFTNILKSTSTNPNNQNTFSPLSVGASSSNTRNVQYISYGIANADSSYVVAVENASSVELTYEGIMKGSNAIPGETIGETFNEWISFGVESELFNYKFSGSVYNDNGNINDQFAKDNPDTIGGVYNNEQYFNGIFDSNESGIAGSTVSLASNCNSSTPNIIANQTVTAANGKYNFIVPIRTINNSNSICIIENDNSNYPIRTTIAKQPISFNTNQYLYEDINFGRVIAANKALVLLKEQAVNDCTISTLMPSSQNNLSYSKKELEGVDPGQCIAYRITATNRANLPITDFVMQDVLQKYGMSNATVTSVLANPARTSGDFNDGLNVGENGTVKTVPLALDAKSQRNFYFNTKYGTTTTP